VKSAKRNLRVEALHSAAEPVLVAEFSGVIRRRYDDHFMAKYGCAWVYDAGLFTEFKEDAMASKISVHVDLGLSSRKVTCTKKSQIDYECQMFSVEINKL